MPREWHASHIANGCASPPDPLPVGRNRRGWNGRGGSTGKLDFANMLEQRPAAEETTPLRAKYQRGPW
eukprot:1969135-Lingulodinium_polyedra.AAC.1